MTACLVQVSPEEVLSLFSIRSEFSVTSNWLNHLCLLKLLWMINKLVTSIQWLVIRHILLMLLPPTFVRALLYNLFYLLWFGFKLIFDCRNKMWTWNFNRDWYQFSRSCIKVSTANVAKLICFSQHLLLERRHHLENLWLCLLHRTFNKRGTDVINGLCQDGKVCQIGFQLFSPKYLLLGIKNLLETIHI